MTDAELIARLRERAVQERIIQKNNEAVAAALMGQRLLFDQGIHSASNSFAVRLGLEHENCAKNDAKLANDWDAAADRIEALTAKVKLMDDLDAINGEKIEALEAKLAQAVEMLDEADRDYNRKTNNLIARHADRIEQLAVRKKALTKERDDYAHKLMQANNTYTEMHLEIERLSDKLATCEKYRDAYDEMGRIGTQAVRDLEAKLAKAVEGQKVNALEQILEERGAVFDAMVDAAEDAAGKDVSFNVVVGRALRAAIAEIKGESHD